MINSAAFQPPNAKKYELKFDHEDEVKGPLYKIILKDNKDKLYQAQDLKGVRSNVILLETKTFTQIPGLFIENENCKSNMVILYSHGNSTDLGRMFRTLQELSQALNVHVFAYEYRGYGPTKGKVGELELIFGIIAAYEYLTHRLGFMWNNIILYGRSIGSGPSIYLASHPDYPVSGVILHSPIASGFRIFDFGFKKTDKSDLFPNCDFIEHVKAHVFLMHGEADIDVTIDHGKLLAAKCRNPYNPWWVEDGDHNNIDYNFRKSYYLRIGKFLRYVRDFNIDKPIEELLEFYTVVPWRDQSNHIYFERIAKVEERYNKYNEKKKKKQLKNLEILTNSVCLTSSPSVESFFLESSEDSLIDRQIRNHSKEGVKDDSFRGPEIQAYVPRSLRSRMSSVIRSKSKLAEIEFSSNSVSSRVNELEDDEDLEMERRLSQMNLDKIPKNRRTSLSETDNTTREDECNMTPLRHMI